MTTVILDINDDVIWLGDGEYDVASFNAAFPDHQYPAVTKIDNNADGLKIKKQDDEVWKTLGPMYYSHHEYSDGADWDDYIDVADLRSYKRCLREEVNTTTHDLIEAGMLYPVGGGEYARFPMTDEDQRNYMGMTIVSASLPYTGEDRLTVKGVDPTTGVDVFWQPDGATDVQTFFGAGLIHVKTALEAGWAIKASIMEMDLAGLQAWTDSRL
jgi:hypothetical protein